MTADYCLHDACGSNCLLTTCGSCMDDKPATHAVEFDAEVIACCDDCMAGAEGVLSVAALTDLAACDNMATRVGQRLMAQGVCDLGQHTHRILRAIHEEARR